MTCLVVRFDATPAMFLSDAVPVGQNEITAQGVKYQLIASGRFFEWLFGADGEVLGVELALTPDDDIMTNHPNLPKLTYLDLTDMFPRLWFTSRTDGAARSCQDWEDYYYEDAEHKLLLLLRTHFLTSIELESLKRSVRAIEIIDP